MDTICEWLFSPGGVISGVCAAVISAWIISKAGDGRLKNIFHKGKRKLLCCIGNQMMCKSGHKDTKDVKIGDTTSETEQSNSEKITYRVADTRKFSDDDVEYKIEKYRYNRRNYYRCTVTSDMGQYHTKIYDKLLKCIEEVESLPIPVSEETKAWMLGLVANTRNKFG